MAGDTPKILIVEPDGEVLEILVASLSRRFDAHITCVSDAMACLDTELVNPNDLVIAEMHLEELDSFPRADSAAWTESASGATLTDQMPNDDAGALELVAQLTAMNNRPVILLADELTCDEAVESLRLGVSDVFRKPFRVGDFLDAVNRALQGHALRKQRAGKYRRMRAMVRRAIRERRELARRTELVCRDLVGAHRRLVHRVLNPKSSRPIEPG